MNRRNALPESARSDRVGMELHPKLLPSVKATRNEANAAESVTAPAKSNPSPIEEIFFSLSLIEARLTTRIPIGTLT